MLKFLQNRGDNSLSKSLRQKPYINFGISLQSPIQFQNNTHTMISHENAYANPFVELQSHRKKLLPPKKMHEIQNNSWIHKTDIHRVQEMKILEDPYLKACNHNEDSTYRSTKRSTRYLETYYHDLAHNQCRFRKTKGEITNFLERNHTIHMHFGPLVGEDRNKFRSLHTRKTIMLKSQKKLELSKQQIKLGQTLRKQGSKLLEEKIDQKQQIRRNRITLEHTFRKTIVQRKSSSKYLFNLPKVIGPQNALHKSLNKDFSFEKQLSKLSSFGLFETIDNGEVLSRNQSIKKIMGATITSPEKFMN